MITHGVVGQPPVDEADRRLVAVWDQGDLHFRGAGRDRVVRLIPTEGEHHLRIGNDLDEIAHSRVLTLDKHAICTAGPWIEVRLGTHPPEVLGRINQEGEDGGRAGVHHHLTH